MGKRRIIKLVMRCQYLHLTSCSLHLHHIHHDAMCISITHPIYIHQLYTAINYRYMCCTALTLQL